HDNKIFALHNNFVAAAISRSTAVCPKKLLVCHLDNSSAKSRTASASARIWLSRWLPIFPIRLDNSNHTGELKPLVDEGKCDLTCHSAASMVSNCCCVTSNLITDHLQGMRPAGVLNPSSR